MRFLLPLLFLATAPSCAPLTYHAGFGVPRAGMATSEGLTGFALGANGMVLVHVPGIPRVAALAAPAVAVASPSPPPGGPAASEVPSVPPLPDAPIAIASLVSGAPAVDPSRCPGGEPRNGWMPCTGGSPSVSGGPTVPCDGSVHTPGTDATLTVTVQRVTVAPAHTPVTAGDLQITGIDLPAGLTLSDGELPAPDPRTHDVTGGHVVLTGADGARWDAQVVDGRVELRDEGHSSTHARSLRGRLRVRAQLRVARVAAPRPHRLLTARESHALDGLRRARPHDGDAALAFDTAITLVNDRMEEGPPQFYNIPIVGHSLVIVVDVSYSMREPDPTARSLPGTPSKLDMLRAQLAQLLGSLPPDVAVNIVAFSSSTRCLWTAPHGLDDAHLDEAIAWIGALQPVDETHPLPALQVVESMAPEQVILLTDGRPTYADEEEPALLTLMASYHTHSVRLDAVGIGPDQNATFLDALAARGHGVAVHL